MWKTHVVTEHPTVQYQYFSNLPVTHIEMYVLGDRAGHYNVQRTCHREEVGVDGCQYKAQHFDTRALG